MSDARSGGQYSLVRAGSGLALGLYFAWLLLSSPSSGGSPVWPILGIVLALLFALGAWDRYAAGLLLVPWILLRGDPDPTRPGAISVMALLTLSAWLPRRPYGAWEARGRVDPDGGWRAPKGFATLAFFFLFLVQAKLGLRELEEGWTFLAWLVFLLLPTLLFARPFGWACLFGTCVASILLRGEPTDFGLALLHLLAFDPAWVSPVRRAQPVRVFYDGSCVLCHGFVRFLLAEDRAGVVRFAPLAGPTFERELAPALRVGLPDSVVVLNEAGRPLVRSEGVRYVLATLGGWWRVFAVALALVPRPLRDLGYDAVARVRKSVFGSTKEACPLMPRELGARFDP